MEKEGLIMIYEGQLLYYIEGGTIHSGHAFDVECNDTDTIFSISGYGTCEGWYRIHDSQLNLWVFQEDALEKAYEMLALDQHL